MPGSRTLQLLRYGDLLLAYDHRGKQTVLEATATDAEGW